ncbi:ATP-binding response regulator [Paracoccus shanxieyensis]|uniref:histidine kinase n=1 Tax=Paracoccus shanxieyensis TaxID=2675752 RepID=A0A6L6IZF0_9RHOB|nr:hybrid sensor histidine kinase/response regulator [Paracoccus shanxieyensis]MTH65906.1 response regulator [Paracoccus shanxieyensis]MTH89185.1 response regulator [Paracoccus shanxieyensis]
MFLRDDDPDTRRVEKLTRISDVLVARIDRLEESRGSSWSMFQAAMALEQEVQVRTRELEQALADLSERNRELAVARALAEEANRSKTRFLRAASHDLLQPLSAAKLFLSALKDTPLDALQTELADRLSGAFESVEELMHAVLDISRLDSQRIEFQRKPVDLGDLFRRLAIEYAPMAEAKGLKLAFAPTSAMVESDPTFLRRIAQNLVSNAIKYTDRGGVLVGVRKRGGRAWLEIMDTGIGIAAADRSRIFDEFQRIGREGGAPGMGLGLSIVRRACAKLGHPIAMDSEPGRGTVFRVSLPLIGAHAEIGRIALPQAGPSLRGRVALVVENDTAMRRAYQLILRDRLGMVARVTAGIPEALAQMGDDPPDVVIADYNLDNGDTGLEAIRALRKAAGEVVPAIIVSARRDPEISRASLELGVPVLEKPLRFEDLQAMLHHILV